MGNPIANLGDYNLAREALKMFNGNWAALYKDIGDTAVANAAPGLMVKGGLITIGLAGVGYGGYKGFHFLKKRIQKINAEPELKKKFFAAIMFGVPTENANSPDCPSACEDGNGAVLNDNGAEVKNEEA
jgi:hypothetical protein